MTFPDPIDAAQERSLGITEHALLTLANRPLTTYQILWINGDGSEGSFRVKADGASQRFELMEKEGVDLDRHRWASYHPDPRTGQPQVCGNDETLKARLRSEHPAR